VADLNRSVRRTTISKDGVEIQTVEHFMASLWGMGIDNAYVEVTHTEMPGLDGSAIEFLQRFKAIGTVEQDAPRRYFSLREPVFVEEGDSCIVVFPDRTLRVSYMLSYDHPLLRSQFVSYTLNGAASFEETIAPARTFCLKEEAESLRTAGF
jgi:UDP-3-O-acyl-N-acetylglucosamine deacetylase